MNIRKPVDYTDLYAQLETALCRNKNQMEQYAAIGKAVALRSEKGAAVAAAGYIREAHPELSGFSPRNLRRMRAFYQTYGDRPDLLDLAMRIGWTLNVLILEADLTLAERAWYLNAALRFGWTKAVLQEKLAESAHLNENEKVEGVGNEDLSTSQPEDSDPHKDRPGAPAYRVAPRHTKLSQLAMSCGFMEKRIFSSHGPVDPFP